MNEFKPVIRAVNSDGEKIICAEIMTGSEPWITLGITKDSMVETLKDPLLEVFVVENNAEIIATFVLQTKGAFTGYLKSIAVKKEWRGRKLGEFMMEFIEDRIFKISKNVFLCVSSFNDNAQRFYLKHGYQNVGLLKYYIVKGHDEILMRKTTGPMLDVLTE
jgi:ribosomal protein S18 acetylase RimI-like enzyme